MKEVLALPSAARALLAEKLVESLEFDVDETLQTLWTDEAKKRRDEVRSGAIENRYNYSDMVSAETIALLVDTIALSAETINLP